MIFYATSGLNQSDILAEEARMTGAQEITPSASGVHFTGDMRTAYRFLLTTHTATRLLLGIYEDDDIRSADEFYDASMLIPWEEWIDPSKSFAVTITTKSVRYLKHSNFGALRLKDAIVDRIREHFDGQRPKVDRDDGDVIFHVHLEGDRATWFVDLSGQTTTNGDTGAVRRTPCLPSTSPSRSSTAPSGANLPMKRVPIPPCSIPSADREQF